MNKLNKEQIDQLSNSIARKCFEAIKIIICNELELYNNKIDFDINGFTNVIINSLSSLDVNILSMAKTIFEKTTSRRIDDNKLIVSYLDVLDLKIKEFQLNIKNEKMN